MALYMKADIHFYHISIIIKMRNISGKVLETIKTHFLFSITFFFRKSCLL